jgi:hypothetical protein
MLRSLLLLLAVLKEAACLLDIHLKNAGVESTLNITGDKNPLQAATGPPRIED